MTELALLAVGAGVSAFLLAVGHWIPKPSPMRTIPRYIYGVGCLLLGFALWRLPLGDWQTVAGLAVIIAAGGGAVIAAYGWDVVILAIRKVDAIEAIDDELT